MLAAMRAWLQHAPVTGRRPFEANTHAKVERLLREIEARNVCGVEDDRTAIGSAAAEVAEPQSR